MLNVSVRLTFEPVRRTAGQVPDRFLYAETCGASGCLRTGFRMDWPRRALPQLQSVPAGRAFGNWNKEDPGSRVLALMRR
jgi:hypothetical protein